MGLFSRLTASIRARSRWREAGAKSYENLQAEVKEAIVGHEPLKAELLTQTARLDQCLRRQEGLAVQAVREGQDEKAAAALYLRLLVSRQLDRLRPTVESISTDRAHLDKMLSRLKLKIQAFRDERKTFAARLPPEEAKTRLSEAEAGMEEELAAVRYALDRAKDKAAEAGISCETARRLASRCAELSPAAQIPDQDREPVARALKRLKAEMRHYDRPHTQR